MRICVVGAGPLGSTTVKQALDEGHEVACFEKSASIGGIWYRHKNDDEEMKAFDNLILTISMKLMAYSDFMTEPERVFYTHRQYLKYLESYADTFNLRPHISLNASVSKVKKTDAGRYAVTVTSNGLAVEHLFDAIAFCVGSFQKPNMRVTDLEKFTGEVVHSARYRNARRFAGRRVLVVGLAESGADIVREISDVAAACTLAIQSRSYLLPRLARGRFSTDALTVRAHHYEMWVRATHVPYRMRAIFGDDAPSRAVFSAATKLYGLMAVAWNGISNHLAKQDAAPQATDGTNNLGQPMQPLKNDVNAEWTQEHVDAINDWNRRSHNHQGNWSQKIIFCKNVSFIPNVVSGAITVKDGSIERIEGQRVYFTDKTSGEFDSIVLCTGFEKDFSRFGADIQIRDNNPRNLYKHAFHPDHGGRVAFIGFTRPFSGAIPLCAEMQARYFALLCSGKISLPANVEHLIAEEKRWEEYWTSLSARHTEAIPSQILYLDSLAKEIGCLMPVSELIRSPRLLTRQWFYSFNQACYRLTGPHSNREAALAELLRETPGPFGRSTHIIGFSILSLLPHFIHPKDTTALSFGSPRPPSKAAPSATI